MDVKNSKTIVIKKVICRSGGLVERLKERTEKLKYLDGAFLLWEQVNGKKKETLFEKIKKAFGVIKKWIIKSLKTLKTK